jgi:hypothetical protein
MEWNPINEIIDPNFVGNLTSVMSQLLWRYFLKFQRNPYNCIHIPENGQNWIKTCGNRKATLVNVSTRPWQDVDMKKSVELGRRHLTRGDFI